MAEPRSFTFAHLADAHVGAWPRDPAIRRALRDSVLRAIEVVRERDCAFLLVSGDLFHTPVPEPSEVAPIAAALRRVVDDGRRVYVIYGSHDYVAHRTSWLDVLAETGIFLRAAPEAVQVEGERYSLPFHRDAPTGAIIAGISGRAHGLDRSYFAALDTESFRAEEGFRIFQFHAAVKEYLPPGLRDHVPGISRQDLPGGVQYYAGGHIHYSYVGEGPEGGLLVNPGAVFGTSVTDLENAALGRTHQGLVVVEVEEDVPRAEFVDTGPRESLRVFHVDVGGRTAIEAKAVVREAIAAQAMEGALLFPRVHGTLKDGTLADLGLREAAGAESARQTQTIHWDIREAAGAPEAAETGPVGEDLETEALRGLQASIEAGLGELRGEAGLRRLRELLRELGVPRGEGQLKNDYEAARVREALRILRLDGVPEVAPAEP